jgi:hypothetical protein
MHSPSRADQIAEREELFARGVASGLTATAAAREAGYPERYSTSKAFSVLRRPRVALRIAELRAATSQADPAERAAAVAVVAEATAPEPHPVPSIRDMRITEAKALILDEAYAVLREARAAKDRRAAIQALSLLCDITGMKQHTVRVAEASPLDDIPRADLLALLDFLRSQPLIEGGDNGAVVEAEADPTA